MHVVRDGLPPFGPGPMGTWPLNCGVKPHLGNVREVDPDDEHDDTLGRVLREAETGDDA